MMFMHKWDWAHSATRLGPLWTLKSHFFIRTGSLCPLTSTTETVSLLTSAGDTAETGKQREKMSDCVEDRGTKTLYYVLVDMVI